MKNLAAAVLLVAGFLGLGGQLGAPAQARGIVPDDPFQTTCQTSFTVVSTDFPEGHSDNLYVSGCYQWNDANTVGLISGPSCPVYSNQDWDPVQNAGSYWYQASSTHLVLECFYRVFESSCFAYGEHFTEYMDAYYNGSNGHRYSDDGCYP